MADTIVVAQAVSPPAAGVASPPEGAAPAEGAAGPGGPEGAAGPDGFKYSSIDGEVIFLSSDPVNVEGAGLAFKTRIKIKGRAFVNRLNRSRLELFPGMRISSAIKIGEQNLGEYLLKPITSQLHYTFSER